MMRLHRPSPSAIRRLCDTQRGVLAQPISISLITPALAHQQQVDAEQASQRISDPVGVTRIFKTFGQPIDDPEPIHDLTLDQSTGFAGQMLVAVHDFNGALESGFEKR